MFWSSLCGFDYRTRAEERLQYPVYPAARGLTPVSSPVFPEGRTWAAVSAAIPLGVVLAVSQLNCALPKDIYSRTTVVSAVRNLPSAQETYVTANAGQAAVERFLAGFGHVAESPHGIIRNPLKLWGLRNVHRRQHAGNFAEIRKSAEIGWRGRQLWLPAQRLETLDPRSACRSGNPGILGIR